MTASGVNGGEGEARSGSRALALLAAPLNGQILRKLAEGPRRLVELRRETGSPAQSTMRSHLRELEGVGALAKTRRNRFPGVLEYELTRPGTELLFVAVALERWLGNAPEEPIPFGSDAAKAAIKALVEGWSSTMLRALAAGPLSLTELDRVIGALNYPSLERRLAAMRLAGQIEARPNGGRGTPYAVTGWLRRGIAPLLAAARWERRHVPDETAPIGRADIEAAFLLAVPLLELPAEISGSCRLGVETTNGRERGLVGALVCVREGRVASCTVRLGGSPDAWASGSAAAWFRAMIEADSAQLELGGHQRLARGLLDGLHGTLFGAGARRL